MAQKGVGDSENFGYIDHPKMWLGCLVGRVSNILDRLGSWESIRKEFCLLFHELGHIVRAAVFVFGKLILGIDKG